MTKVVHVHEFLPEIWDVSQHASGRWVYGRYLVAPTTVLVCLGAVVDAIRGRSDRDHGELSSLLVLLVAGTLFAYGIWFVDLGWLAISIATLVIGMGLLSVVDTGSDA